MYFVSVTNVYIAGLSAMYRTLLLIEPDFLHFYLLSIYSARALQSLHSYTLDHPNVTNNFCQFSRIHNAGIQLSLLVTC